MKKSKKIDLVALLVFGVLGVSIVMAIVGICIDWTTTTSSTLLTGSNTLTSKLADLAENYAKLQEIKDTSGMEGFTVMQAFAYITLALTVLTAIVFVVSKFVNVKALKWVVIAVSALTVISAIVMIATSYGFCSKYSADLTIGNLNIANSTTSPAAGPWLLCVFSVLGGAGGVVGALKK